MCLDYMDKEPKRKWGVGYKAVRKTNRGEYVSFDFIPNAGKIKYPLNEWITDKNKELIEGGGFCGCPTFTYPAGFHVSLSKPKPNSVLHEVIIKVQFRQVVATDLSGKDNTYGKQVVARQIKNLGEI